MNQKTTFWWDAFSCYADLYSHSSSKAQHNRCQHELLQNCVLITASNQCPDAELTMDKCNLQPKASISLRMYAQFRDMRCTSVSETRFHPHTPKTCARMYVFLLPISWKQLASGSAESWYACRRGTCECIHVGSRQASSARLLSDACTSF